MTGKEKRKSLQQIRQKIADANGIAYAPEPCIYEGEDCSGTCPKCDADLAYLEAELSKKYATGAQSSLTGLAADLFGRYGPRRKHFFFYAGRHDGGNRLGGTSAGADH